ncbi:J domain-containing protein [Acaryochloris sp. IP29b_bin.148]|uniref:J domain-containing protein n=1 Tax=Acaryochloris sp. IP29b_bin.148 TaxID=2969218 RepID=UPI0026325BAD|nr:J domain-containing protein [Acaryochloris sp. IP29b_bin.148]
MQNFRNYYDILKVAKNASNEEIKRSYRKLARQYHPDLNPGDKAAEEQFKIIGEAYDVLSDAEKRSQYDQFGQYWQQQGFQKPSSPQSTRKWSEKSSSFATDKVDFSEFADFQEFLDQLLDRPYSTKSNAGKRSKPQTKSPRKGRRDAEARLTIPLEKAYAGGRERIRLEDGRSLEVNMPMGMVSGQRIRLKGQGTAGGDLYLKIDVSPHAFYRLEGNDIVCELPITCAEAVLGGQIEAPTLDGWVKVTIPSGVRSGQRLRLGGKGYPASGGKRGDQLVEIRIESSKNISARERELYEQIRQIETYKPRANLPI